MMIYMSKSPHHLILLRMNSIPLTMLKILGVFNALTNPPPFEDVDLFAFIDRNPLGSPFRDRKIARTRKVHVV